MRHRLLVILLLLSAQAGAVPFTAETDATLVALLPDMPGWTVEPGGGASHSEDGVLALRSYRRGAQRAVLTLVLGRIADGVAGMISTMPAEQFVPPLPQDRWTERGYRLWETQRDGAVYEAGMVLSYVPGQPDRSANASITGDKLPLADALDLLHSLDWDRIKSLAAQ